MLKLKMEFLLHLVERNVNYDDSAVIVFTIFLQLTFVETASKLQAASSSC